MNAAHSATLYGLWLLPILAFVMFWAQRKARRDLRDLLGPGGSESIAPPSLWRRRAWRTTLMLLAISLGVVALAQPRWGHDWKEQEVKGLEIVVALDVSRSMDAEDVDPSRVERARREAVDLIQAMPTSRIGLVLFAGGAYPRMPQTLDHQALRDILNRTGTQTIRAQGSSIASALREARGLMDLETKADRAVLLLSDGESWDADLSRESTVLTDAGIRVYSVGIGTEAGAPIPNPNGGFKKDNQGELVISRLDDSVLKKIAAETGGAYVKSIGGAGDTREVVQALNNQLVASSQGQHREKIWDERFQWPLATAVFLFFGAALVSDKRTRTLILLGALCWGIEVPDAQAQEQDPVVDVRNPRDLWALAEIQMREGRYEEAYRGFTELADRALDQSMRKGARYNAGNAAYGAGKLEEALTAWDRVLESDPDFEPAKRNADAVRQEIAQRLQEEPPEEQPSEDSEDSENSEDGESSEDSPPEESESEPSEEDSESSEEGEREEEPDPSEAQDESGEMPELAEGESGDTPPEEAPLVEGVQEMSVEEAMRLLEGVEEGKPYVVVGGESSEKDW